MRARGSPETLAVILTRLQKLDGKNGNGPTRSGAGAGRRRASRVWDTHHPGHAMSLALGAGGTTPGPAEAGQEACGGLWFQENANQFQMVMEHPASPSLP